MNLLIDYSILIYFCTSHATHLLFVTLIQNVIINSNTLEYLERYVYQKKMPLFHTIKKINKINT